LKRRRRVNYKFLFILGSSNLIYEGDDGKYGRRGSTVVEETSL
jgi:hypothetical protein